MSKPADAEPVKLIFSIFAPAEKIINDAVAKLTALYGRPDFISAWVPFEYTDYYHREMGSGLGRRFLSNGGTGKAGGASGYQTGGK